MKGTRQNEKKRNGGKAEIKEKSTLQQSFRERFIEKTIKNAFTKKSLESALPHARRGVTDLLDKLYPVNLLSQEQKEDLVERVTRSVLENYDPNEKRGFHAQAIIWISQHLPDSPIFGKLPVATRS